MRARTILAPLAAVVALSILSDSAPAQPGPAVALPPRPEAEPAPPPAVEEPAEPKASPTETVVTPVPATTLRVGPAQPDGTSFNAVAIEVSRARVEPIGPSRVEIRPLVASEGSAVGATGSSFRVVTGPTSTVTVAPKPALPASRAGVEPLAPSQALVDPLPVSRAVIGPLAPSATSQIQQLRSELNARETERGTVVTLPGDVLFDFDKWDVRRDARPALAKLAELIRLTPGAPVAVEGHTDAKGADAYNLELSRKRARSVADWLARQHGIERARLREEGRGEAAPVAPNERADGRDDPAGRQRNRRVEVILERG